MLGSGPQSAIWSFLHPDMEPRSWLLGKLVGHIDTDLTLLPGRHRLVERPGLARSARCRSFAILRRLSALDSLLHDLEIVTLRIVYRQEGDLSCLLVAGCRGIGSHGNQMLIECVG